MFLLLHVLLSFNLAHAQNSCNQHNPMSPDVPECPTSGSTLLSENYPMMAATVSDQIGGPRYVKDYVLKVLKAQGDKPPQFFLHVQKSTYQELVREIKKQAPDAATADKWIKGLSQVDTRHRWNWQQDYFESFFDTKTGQPVLREVEGYGRHGSAFTDMIKKTSKDCSIQAGPKLATHDNYKSGHSGGNLEAVNGLCLVGSDHFEGNEWDKYVKTTCTNPETAVKAPSDFLNVGHTDEFFKTLKDPSQPAPCDFSLAFASPKKALDLLKKNPSGRAINFSGLPEEEVLARLQAPPYRTICQIYLDNKEHDGQSPGNGRSRRQKGISHFIWDSLIPRTEAGSYRSSLNDQEQARMQRFYDRIQALDSQAPQSDEEARERRQKYYEIINRMRALQKRSGMVKVDNDLKSAKDCYGMTNADLAKIIEDDFEFKEFNEAVEKRTQEFKKDLLGRLKKQYPQCSPKTAELPDLFLGEMNYDSENPTYVMGSADSIFPNPTNGEIVQNTFILPEPVNPAFKEDIEKTVQSLGLKTDYIDTHFAHVLNGNLHCSSHAIRYCRPQGGTK